VTTEELKRLRELCDAATKGEWVTAWSDSKDRKMCFEGVCVPNDDAPFDWSTLGFTATRVMRIEVEKGSLEQLQAQANARFIAESRTALPALLDEVERLEREVAELRRQLSNRIEAKRAKVWTCTDDRGPIIADDGRAAMIFVPMGGRWVNHKLHSWTEQGYKGSGYSQMPDAMAAEFLKTYPLPTEAVCE
jgi:hypothetical protein